MNRFLTTVAFLMLLQPSFATNRGFMPGDAFFHSVLTQDGCAALAKSKSPTLRFVRPKGYAFAMCGYAGFWSLQLPADSDRLIGNLTGLYAGLRRHSPRELTEYLDSDGNKSQIEANGFHIFVYNDDFDPLRYDIVLRYNETWVEDEASFGPHPAGTQLESFVIDRVAFSNDWRDAKAVPRLNAICPPIPEWKSGFFGGRTGQARIDEPVVAKEAVQVIVLTTDDFRRYIHQRNGATFYSVTDAGVTQYTVKKREWVVSDWSPDAE